MTRGTPGYRAPLTASAIVVILATACGGQSETASPAATPAPAPAASAPAAAATPAIVTPPMAPAPTANAAPAASAPPQPLQGAEQPEADEHRAHHHGGVLLLISMSLHDLELSPEQRTTISKVGDDLALKMEPARAAGRELAETLAAGVEAGAIDRAKVDAAIAKLTAQVQAQSDAPASALDQLHVALTPPERAALVADVQSHWEKWKEAHGQDEKTDGKHRSGHLLALIQRLGLSKDQAEKIKANFRERMKGSPQDGAHKEVDDYLKTFDVAFKADTFSAKNLTKAKGASTHMARWGATRMARFVEAAAPVLTAAQRTKLAEMLRKG